MSPSFRYQISYNNVTIIPDLHAYKKKKKKKEKISKSVNCPLCHFQNNKKGLSGLQSVSYE